MRWMNEKKPDELKNLRKTLDIMTILMIPMQMTLYGTFLYYWFFTTDLLLPFALGVTSIIFFIMDAVYIMKRDMISILIYLKEQQKGIQP